MPSTAHADLLGMLRETEALLEGHFVLSSGRHSSQYVQCARLLSFPRHARCMGREIADLVSSLQVDVVVGPALGGMLVAHEIAGALDVRCLFAERIGAGFELRRGFEIRPKERVLVAEDVVTTGGSAREVAAVVERQGGVVIGFAAIVNRSGNGDSIAPCAKDIMPATDLPLFALQRLTFETFDPADCPLCAAGMPAVKPGSRPS